MMDWAALDVTRCDDIVTRGIESSAMKHVDAIRLVEVNNDRVPEQLTEANRQADRATADKHAINQPVRPTGQFAIE